MFKRSLAFGFITVSMFAPYYANANDSEAEIAIGGLKLKQSKSISLDSEDLFISENLVKVSYKFTNNSDADIKTLVSFPLPAFPGDYEEVYFEEIGMVDVDSLKFKTLVDGKSVAYKVYETAMIGDKDVTEKLKQEGLPLNWPRDYYNLDEKFKAMDKTKRDDYLTQGLIKDEAGNYFPTWSLVTNITREQIFPARKTISVIHSYVPTIGGSVGGGLNREYRTAKDGSGKHYKEKYCTDKSFLSGFDAKETSKKYQAYSETWIGYVLKSGANWQGPIKNFKLTIDKGNAENMVSFCMDNVKKISPTRFEVTKTNFEPKQDLDILIVKWYKGEN